MQYIDIKILVYRNKIFKVKTGRQEYVSETKIKFFNS